MSHTIRNRLSLIQVFSLIVALIFVQSVLAAGSGPRVGQGGKDVIWLPTSESLVAKMLDLAKVTRDDFVIDLGSGDGRTVIEAAKRGARALGIEHDSELLALSRQNALQEGVSDRAKFAQADLFDADLSKATVITMFLLPSINLKLRPKLLDLKPGTRIVSNSFTMGEWKPDASVTADRKEGCTTYCTAHLWIVPARVEGTWNLSEGEISLRQNFQEVSGTITTEKETLEITKAHLSGDRISFAAGDHHFTGRVKGDVMEGTFKSEAKKDRGTWSARRGNSKRTASGSL